MKERPILFSGAMVKAILEGRKTQTRRVVNPQPVFGSVQGIFHSWQFQKRGGGAWLYPNAAEQVLDSCPYGKPGDRLWVRENMRRPDGDPWIYDADNQPVQVDFYHETEMLVWAHHKEQDYCPSIHMPRFASRITLEITNVRVERVQNISEEDARAEGVESFIEDGCGVYRDYVLGSGTWCWTAKASFVSLWSSINEKRGFGWDKSPWVWAISFKRIDAAERAA